MKIEELQYKEGIKLIDNIPNQKDSTIYQSKEFLNLYHQSQYFRIIGLRPEINCWHKHFFFLAGYDGQILKYLMACEHNKKTGTVGLMGDQKQLNTIYYDVETFTYEDYISVVDYFKNREDVKSLLFQNIDKETILYHHIKCYCAKNNNHLRCEERNTVCVSIAIENKDYDTWFANLSKSVRQNVRTAYNHFKSDGVKYEVRHYLGGADFNVIRKEMLLQRRRNQEKHGMVFKGKTRVMCRIGSWLSMINPRTRMLMKSDSSYICELWIEGVLAAFVGGYLSSNGRFFIPFLKCNMDYKRYSPGGVVICESIKYLCGSDFDLKRYDLLTGDEPYKYSYGGEKYENANIEIFL